MSKTRRSLDTLPKKSSWTPKNFVPTNEKIFKERLSLIKKWYAAWSEDQRWTLLEYILMQLSDDQLLWIHDLLQPPPAPPPDHDFTRVLPRFLCLKIFSLLDPQSLCRAAQVCWYWKYLAESNEIWQEKCLKLDWFLPSPPPPHMRDCTLWKRHYIACVCQLHWNPPQFPEEPDAEEGDLMTTTEEPEGNKKTKKKRFPVKHLVNLEARRPWRDPDPHPQDIQYTHKIDTMGSPLYMYSRFPSLRSREHMSATTPSTTPLPLPPPPPPSGPFPPPSAPLPLPPPTALLHPTLLEKMRLSSPTPAHVDLSTLNRQQTENEINDTFYRLQDASPFPKLPPYFVHQSEGEDGGEIGMNTLEPSRGSPLKSPRLGKRASGMAVNGRPPSGKSTVSIITPGRDHSADSSTIGELSPKFKATFRKEEWLPTRPWYIPDDDDENT